MQSNQGGHTATTDQHPEYPKKKIRGDIHKLKGVLFRISRVQIEYPKERTGYPKRISKDIQSSNQVRPLVKLNIQNEDWISKRISRNKCGHPCGYPCGYPWYPKRQWFYSFNQNGYPYGYPYKVFDIHRLRNSGLGYHGYPYAFPKCQTPRCPCHQFFAIQIPVSVWCSARLIPVRTNHSRDDRWS